MLIVIVVFVLALVFNCYNVGRFFCVFYLNDSFVLIGKGISWLVFFLVYFLKYFVLRGYRSLLFKFNTFFEIFRFEANFSYSSDNNFSSFQKEHFWSKLGIHYQFVVRFIFVFLFLISLQQVSFYFVVNDRFSYFKVCSVHHKICVLQKLIMFSFFICLKFICRNVRENLNLSQGNQGKVREFLHQTWLATL